MRKYSSNLAFVDLLFNLLIGFCCLFIIAFLLINPIAKQGTIDPPVKMMIEMTWDNESQNDIDLYLKGPDGGVIFYANKQNGYITLKRDDLGYANDTYIVNGKTFTVKRNYEIITLTDLPDGDYVLNVHHFSNRSPAVVEEVFVKLTNLAYFNVAFDSSAALWPRQQKTMAAFRVKDNKVVEIRDDIQVQLRTGGFGP